MALQQEGGHRHDIVDPVGKRHRVQREDIQPVVKILAEITCADLLGHVAVGGRDHAHIDRDIGLRADRGHGLFL